MGGAPRGMGVTGHVTVVSTLPVLFLALAMVLPMVRASPIVVSSPIAVSGPSPFATPGCEGAPQSGRNFPNAEVEPWVAVDPAHPMNIVGVWQQDRWSNGGAKGLIAAVTHNGGLTWTRTWAHFSRCSGGNAANGGDYERASDPWVTFAPNGDVYQIALSFNDSNFREAILVSKSTDGGDTWSEPVALIRDTSPVIFDDKESITADPTAPGFVYAIWDRGVLPAGEQPNINALHSFAFRGDAMFSRTTNGGRSWEPARAIFAPLANEFTIGHQIVVLPGGTLVDITVFIRGSGKNAPGGFLAVMRSTDKGVTWTGPTIIANDRAVLVTDPDTGQAVRTGAGLPDIGVDPVRGTLYVVWEDSRFSVFDHNDIALTISNDGGLSWSVPVKINRSPAGVAAFTPSVEVLSDGTVGVTYYDFRSNTPAPGLPTDYWLIHCHAVCGDPGSWTENHAAGPFDMETAPFARGLFVGDYEGLTTAGNTFLALFVQANSGNLANRTDVFFAKAGP